METSDSLDIVVGDAGVVSFYRKSYSCARILPLCVDVVGADGVDVVFDGSLEGFITLTRGFLHWK